MRESIFEKIKRNVSITDVAERFGGLKLNRNNMACCPFHAEKNPSFSVKEDEGIFKCFSCGAGGDAADLVAKIRGIEPIEAARLIAEAYGLDGEQTAPRPVKRPLEARNGSSVKEAEPGAKAEIRAYLEACAGNADKTDFFERRGLNADTVRRFRLGYDEAKRWAVFPYSSKLEYYQARSVDDKRFRKPPADTAGREPLYNASALYNAGSEPVFIVESPVCALSIAQCGGQAVALCGVNGAAKLLETVKDKPPAGVLVLCLDNDEAGRKAQGDLAAALCELNAKYHVYNIADVCKDPNELLATSPERLRTNVTLAKKEAKNKFRSKKDGYMFDELMSRDIPPLEWVIEGLIPEGATLLCAPGKTGKSWLAFDMCISVAKGRDFLGMKTKKSNCIYFALEDKERRLQDRGLKLEKGSVPGLRLVDESDRIGTGFIEKMQELVERDSAKLVVIDVLRCVRSSRKKNDDIYEKDSEDLAAIKSVADKNRIAIVIIHHVRKMKDKDDPHNNIMGSNGTQGAADTVLMIEKDKRADKKAKLIIDGRDVDFKELEIEFNPNTLKWSLIGDAVETRERRLREEYEGNPVIKTIKELLRRKPQGWSGTASEIFTTMHDILGEATGTPLEIGRILKKWEYRLVIDKIDIKKSHSRKGEKYTFSHKRNFGNFYDMRDDVRDDVRDSE
jgi:phage/plasmid primase-like uncharacterized protein